MRSNRRGEPCAWLPAGSRSGLFTRRAYESPAALPLSTLYLNEARAVLNEEKGKHREHVFTYKGRPLGQLNTRSWRNALKRAGIKNFRWHDLRHVWATGHVMAPR